MAAVVTRSGRKTELPEDPPEMGELQLEGSDRPDEPGRENEQGEDSNEDERNPETGNVTPEEGGTAPAVGSEQEEEPAVPPEQEEEPAVPPNRKRSLRYPLARNPPQKKSVTQYRRTLKRQPNHCGVVRN